MTYMHRRYIYNQAKCFRCGGAVLSWQLNARTCYACATCQPRPVNVADLAASGVKSLAAAAAPRLFESHCAREGYTERSADPAKLNVKELQAELKSLGLPVAGKKAELVTRLFVGRRTPAVFGSVPQTSADVKRTRFAARKSSSGGVGGADAAGGAGRPASAGDDSGGGGGGCEKDVEAEAVATTKLPLPGIDAIPAFKSYAAARVEKLVAGEALNVEHVADVDLTSSLVDWIDLHSDDKGVCEKVEKKKKKSKRKRKRGR